MVKKTILTAMIRIITVVLLSTLVTTSMVLIPAEPAYAGIVGDVLDGIKSRVRGVVKPLTDAIKSVVNQIKSVVGQIKSVVDQILGFFSDFITFIVGLNPNDLDSFVRKNLNETACQNLPMIVNDLHNHIPALPHLTFIDHLLPFDLRLDFTDLIGIDPSTADTDALFLFKTKTDLPIATLAGMAEFPFTIPSGIASAFSSFCVEATEHHLASKEDEGKLQNQLHHDLAMVAENGKHNANAMNQLPAAQGGLLEAVRSLVSETINRFEAAGERLKDEPHLELEKGDTAFAEGRFRDAYRHYQKAYSSMTKT